MQLIIVESPTKAKTLQGFLGPKYKVLASFGHVRDLPKNNLGVDVEHNFEPKYIIPTKARKTIKLLRDAVKETKSTILATDEDREGEAIAWHLVEALKLGGEKEPYERIVFHEITKPAIEKALKNPRQIDINLVDSQQARRILDRIVGYKLSPFLWKKVARGLSAGRVQSVAVRLVVDREREIENFKPEEYWTIVATLFKTKEFEANLIKIDDKVLDKLEVKNKEEADKILKDLEESEYKVENIEQKEEKRNPLPPFTTSTLQQEAFRRLRFSSKFTMRIAQQLYEMGYITYHRTDSLNLSESSLFTAKKFITETFGENYWGGFLKKYKTKSKGAQEAHEAIRPTDPFRDKPAFAEASAGKLYDLIWRRFIACQMAQALFHSAAIDISAAKYLPAVATALQAGKIQKTKYTFRATGQTLKFDGFLKVYPIKFSETDLPVLEKDEILELIKLTPSQHWTLPPARYNEASLIKVLEENGIGRPSTYAPTLATIQDRNYIEKDEQRRFRPTKIGKTVNDILAQHFPEIVDIKFTAELEEKLDKIAEDSKEWVPTIKEFYGPFANNLEKKYKDVSKKEFTEKPTKEKCEDCGSPLLIRLGRYGEFYACSNFPKCKYTKSLKENSLGLKCPKCETAAAGASLAPSERGEIVTKRTKRKKIFYGCKNWPKCDFALWDKPVQAKDGNSVEKCPKCGSALVETKRKQIHPNTITGTNSVNPGAEGTLSSFGMGVKCSNKECDYKAQ
ncbi:MAG: type I DNA topoisomerase [Patescibacteria group bacterium]